MDPEATFNQGLDDRAVRHLDGHEDRLRRRSRQLEDPGRHRGQTFAAVSERPRAELRPRASDIRMLCAQMPSRC